VAFSDPERGHQVWEPENVEDAPQIVGKRGQAELGANLLQPPHQKRTLMHPLLDSAKREEGQRTARGNPSRFAVQVIIDQWYYRKSFGSFNYCQPIV
jgi:hypothetical protein